MSIRCCGISGLLAEVKPPSADEVRADAVIVRQVINSGWISTLVNKKWSNYSDGKFPDSCKYPYVTKATNTTTQSRKHHARSSSRFTVQMTKDHGHFCSRLIDHLFQHGRHFHAASPFPVFFQVSSEAFSWIASYLVRRKQTASRGRHQFLSWSQDSQCPMLDSAVHVGSTCQKPYTSMSPTWLKMFGLHLGQGANDATVCHVVDAKSMPKLQDWSNLNGLLLNEVTASWPDNELKIQLCQQLRRLRYWSFT